MREKKEKMSKKSGGKDSDKKDKSGDKKERKGKDKDGKSEDEIIDEPTNFMYITL